MSEFFGSLATLIGGAFAGGIGFVIVALGVVVLLVPLVLLRKNEGNRRKVR